MMLLMRLQLVLCMLAVIPAARPAIINCVPSAASVPVFDPSSTSGAVGDYTLDCTGGTFVAPPMSVPVIDVDALMNVPVLTGSWILSDGVNMTPGMLVGTETIEFNGVPFNPVSGSVVFTIENILVNPSLEPPGFQYTENVGIFGDISTEIMDPEQLVGVNAPEPVTSVWIGLAFGAFLWLSRWGKPAAGRYTSRRLAARRMC
jgi:hypothetical protein